MEENKKVNQNGMTRRSFMKGAAAAAAAVSLASVLPTDVQAAAKDPVSVKDIWQNGFWTGKASFPKGAWMVNLSHNESNVASCFSTFSVNANNPKQIAVGWRKYGLPTNTKAGIGDWVGDYHLSVSEDGGKTFTDIDMMPRVREIQREDGLPEEEEYSLWWCNGPWATYGADGTLYTGAICYTALDRSDPEHPRQGRALVFVSHDNGKTFNRATYGMRLSNFADDAVALAVSATRPSTTGIPVGSPGTDPWHTPWDGNFGVASATTDMFVSICGGNVVVSKDGAETYDLVHSIKYPKGWTCSSGTPCVDGNKIIVPFIVTECPDPNIEARSMGVVTSDDNGLTWSDPIIAIAGSQINSVTSVRQVRSPISAASPVKHGHWAFVQYSNDHLRAKVVYTKNGGKTWKSAETPACAGYDDYVEAREVCVGYTAAGEIVVAYRGQKTWANYYTFAALLGKDGRFHKTVLAAPEISTYPYETTQGNYNTNTGSGDYCGWVSGGRKYCYVDVPYSSDGTVLDQYLVAIPLDAMR
ncbi:MAG: sialidase family protein [Clostridiales bacterium]|nr:sialidase family protein [Clostridiales bacterium]